MLSLWRLSAAVVFSQSLFHGLFSLGSASSAAGAPVPAAGHAGHAAHTMAAASGSGLPGTGTMVMDQASPLMWAGHALAALATIAVLRHGEVTAVRLITALRLRVVAFLPVFLPLAVNPALRLFPPIGRSGRCAIWAPRCWSCATVDRRCFPSCPRRTAPSPP